MASSWYLSKSKLMSGQQCAKRLWLEVNEPDELEHSAATERSFAIGHAVGDAAQSLYPDGILIEYDDGLDKPLKETERLLSKPGPLTLFEATFQADGVLIRADVLVRDESDAVRLIEVKAAASVKEYHLNDCAIQLWVLEQLGLDVVRVDLAHINNQFVYPGGGDYKGLFTYENVTSEARERQSMVPRLVQEMRAVLDGPEPKVPMGAQCTKPFECPFIDYCKGPQAEMPVSWLPGGKRFHARLEADGYRDIRDIPDGHLTNSTAEWARQVTIAGLPDLRPDAAVELNALGWPRSYFAFETLAPPVPVFARTRPYKYQAFQWSGHVESEAGEVEHREFLADGDGAPMRACAQALIDALGDTGPILMYTPYERGVIENLMGLYPDLAGPLSAIILSNATV